MNESFAILREYLTSPSKQHWKAILDLLEQWPEDSLEFAIEYAKNHLGDWPDRLRRILLPPTKYLWNLSPDSPRAQLSRTLSFAHSSLTPGKVRKLVSCRALQNIHILDLDYCGIGLRGISFIPSSSVLRNLRELHLARNRLGMKSVQYLIFASEVLENVDLLNLAFNSFGNMGAEMLSIAESLGKLEFLGLAYCKIGSEGIELLAGSKNLSNLRDLYLAGNKVGPDGAVALAQSPRLGKLEKLDLRWCLIGDKGAQALAESTGLTQLKKLLLEGNRISPKAEMQLRNAEIFQKTEIEIW